MKVPAAVQAQGVQIAALAVFGIALVWMAKQAGNRAAGAFSDAVDGIIHQAEATWTAIDSGLKATATTSIADLAAPAPGAIPAARVDLPTSPAGIVFALDTLLSRVTAWATAPRSGGASGSW